MTEDTLYHDCARLEDELKLCVLSFMQNSKQSSTEKLLVIQATVLSFYMNLMTRAGHDPDEIIRITKEGIKTLRDDKRSAS